MKQKTGGVVLEKLMQFFKRRDKPVAATSASHPNLPVPVELVPGDSAVEARRLRLGGEVVPILMGGPEDVELMEDLAESAEESVEQILAKADEIDVDAWFSQREEDEVVQ